MRYPQGVDRNGRSVRLRALMPLMWAGACDTNNVTERVISRRKIRYKTLRGYKSMEGMMNGLWLTQRVWGEAGVDMDELLAA